MQIKMTQTAFGTANESGNVSREYKDGEIIDCSQSWQVSLANTFVEAGLAIEIKITAPTEKKKASKKVAKKKATKKK